MIDDSSDLTWMLIAANAVIYVGLILIGLVVIWLVGVFRPPLPEPMKRGFEVKLTTGQTPVLDEKRENDHG